MVHKLQVKAPTTIPQFHSESNIRLYRFRYLKKFTSLECTMIKVSILYNAAVAWVEVPVMSNIVIPELSVFRIN